MKWVWYVVIGVVVLMGIYAIYATVDVMSKAKEDTITDDKKKFETGYFEGQRDALDGDIRIRKVDNRTYVWIKSPWVPDTTKPYLDTIKVTAEYSTPIKK
jgi:hypothetical protein